MSEKDLTPCAAIQHALDAAGIKLGQLCCVVFEEEGKTESLVGSFSLDGAVDLLLFSTKNAYGRLKPFNNFWFLGDANVNATLADIGFISVTPVIEDGLMAELEDILLITPCSDGGACSRKCIHYNFCVFTDRLPDEDDATVQLA